MSDTTPGMSNKGGLLLAIIFLAIIFSIVSVPTKSNETEALQAAATESFTFSHSPFENAILEADVAYIENLETGKTVYQKNGSEVLPLASLTKIMTTYSALSLFPEDAKIKIDPEDLQGEGDHGLVVGEVWDLKDLLTFMLVSSSNDAALAIEREAKKYTNGIPLADYMNEQAIELGFESLSFRNASGLDQDEEGTIPGAYGTAEDITKLFSLTYKTYPEIFNLTKEQKITFETDIKSHTAENTNIALHEMPGIISSKTGYTNTAGGNLTVIVNIDDVPHVVTVLHSSRGGRFEDIEKIIELASQENKL